MSNAITRVGPHEFRVDFARLRRASKSLLARIFPRQERVEVDPFLIGQAIQGIMQRCKSKNVHGQRLVWNEFKIFLSSRDHHGLRSLVAGLQAGLDTMIRQTQEELEAEMKGDPMVRILIDEVQEVAQGMGAVRVDFVENQNFARPESDEVTVRVMRGRPLPPPSPDPRRRSAAADPAAVCLAWDGNEVPVETGTKVLAGRSHPDPPPNFVQLAGASQVRISRRHLAIENAADGVVITRPSDANPVEVDGRPVQRGGKRSVDALPVEIALSNGEMRLRLKPCGS